MASCCPRRRRLNSACVASSCARTRAVISAARASTRRCPSVLNCAESAASSPLDCWICAFWNSCSASWFAFSRAAIFSSRLRNHQPPLVFEDGLQSRDFVHVSDIVQAFSLALARTDVADVNLNVGTGRATSVIAIARGLGRALGVPLDPEVLGRFREGDIRHCVADITRAQRLLGYVPRVRLEEGLAELAEWSRSQAPEDRVEQARTELEDKRLIR